MVLVITEEKQVSQRNTRQAKDIRVSCFHPIANRKVFWLSRFRQMATYALLPLYTISILRLLVLDCGHATLHASQFSGG